MSGVDIEGVTRTEGNGAILNAVLSVSSSLKITSSSFTSCNTQSGDGGVLWISCPSLFPSASLVIDATFTTCSCDSAHKGKWVFVQGQSLLSLMNPDNWASTVTTLTTPANDSLLMGENLAEAEGASFRSLSLLFYLVDFKGATITTGDGEDAKGCGQSTLPCSSIDEAWFHLQDSPRILIISPLSQLTSQLTLNETNVEMKPTSGTGTVRIGKTGSFLLSTHSLSSTSLSFVPIVASATRDASLFSVVGGSLTITSCSFADFSLASVTLISSSCDVSISHSLLNTVLSDCSNSKGGSAILLTKGTGASFSSSDWEGTFDLSSEMGKVLVLDLSQPASNRKTNPFIPIYLHRIPSTRLLQPKS
ncbi:hypothetical protein BLNAU_16992 [Blattamonas nauphoetae]|uniref:Uncharacterized protein n=1 Tax=Blattamonas nauphoetae TaxID=2049346 RepID=A0ABQ9XA10_9EUKA|nr:hypothetical protein BLNAU_16992 [Blattamonas nauphoetae]